MFQSASRVGAVRLVLMLALLAAPAYAISDPAEMLANPTQEARAERIGSQLRCLVCQNESIEDSGAPLARDLRAIVRRRVVAGDSDREVVAWMVARYGNFVRLSPPLALATVLLWFSPLLALLAGLVAVLLGRRRVSAPPTPLSEAERAQLEALIGLPSTRL